MNQLGLERMLRTVNLLCGKTLYSVREVARDLDVTPRTVYRYMDTLSNAGFMFHKIRPNVYHIVKYPDDMEEMKNIVNFTSEEACLVERLISCLDDRNELKANLMQKLSAVYRFADMKHFTVHKGIAHSLDTLRQAMEQKRRVKLIRYASAAASEWRDYEVEPFEFDTDNVNVTAYDVSSGKNKFFKVARIERVKLLDAPWEYEASHVHLEADAFHMAGPVGIPVKLELSLRARNLMLEEYPLSEPYIYEADGKHFFDGEVRKAEGIGRFVTGLIPEIEILEGDFLREYVHGRCAEGASKTLGPASPEGQ